MSEKINFDFPIIQNADLKDKIVLVRVDHNVVKKGVIYDPYRIDATIGTLFHIVVNGGKLILMTHVGRPKNKVTGEISPDDATSVLPIIQYLESKLNIRIACPNFENRNGINDIETSINHLIKDLKQSKIDCIYLPNTRWFLGEEDKAEIADKFAYQLAGLADIYINDAFGSWQAHVSTVGIPKHLPSYAGFLMQKEVKNLDRIFNAESSFIAVVAGSKFDTKIEPLFALLQRVDYLFLGGVIYNVYLCAKYDIKIKGVSEEEISYAKNFLERIQEYSHKIIELQYIVESETLEEKNENTCKVIDIEKVKKGESLNYILDVHKSSFEKTVVRDLFLDAKTVFVNAVMGYTPYFNQGTIALDSVIDENKEAVKLYGGGDTMQELKRLLPGLYIMALDNPNYYIFTGGGAVLKAIQFGTANMLKPIIELINHQDNN